MKPVYRHCEENKATEWELCSTKQSLQIKLSPDGLLRQIFSPFGRKNLPRNDTLKDRIREFYKLRGPAIDFTII